MPRSTASAIGSHTYGMTRAYYAARYVEDPSRWPRRSSAIRSRSSSASGGQGYTHVPARSSGQAGSLRSGVIADHGVDEVVGAAVGVAGGAGDVGFAVGAVVSDGGVA